MSERVWGERERGGDREREVELRKLTLTSQVQKIFLYESLSRTARQLLGKPSSVVSLGLFQRFSIWSASLMIFVCFGGVEKPTSFTFLLT